LQHYSPSPHKKIHLPRQKAAEVILYGDMMAFGCLMYQFVIGSLMGSILLKNKGIYCHIFVYNRFYFISIIATKNTQIDPDIIDVSQNAPNITVFGSEHIANQ